ncbi:MAG: hypothetical protein JSV56_08550 [Methanomassiliicoccales archaeon]|nr:MAG: hypothetical protein JSV56_08550 [Methanomassiliicoccales archaeon]
MPRISRGLADGYVYHVLNCGNGRQEGFHKDKDYEAFVDLLREAKERYSVKILSRDRPREETETNANGSLSPPNVCSSVTQSCAEAY